MRYSVTKPQNKTSSASREVAQKTEAKIFNGKVEAIRMLLITPPPLEWEYFNNARAA